MSSAARTDASADRLNAWTAVRETRARGDRLDGQALDIILSAARTHYAWTDRAVAPALLRTIYDVAAAGPTSMNSSPARFIFVSSPEAKARLAKALKPYNVPKILSAPVTAIIAYDLEFWRRLPQLFPHDDRRPLFQDNPDYTHETAFRNSTLQGAYLMIAARAHGLDVGAISGFDNAVVDTEFFAGTALRSNFLCSIGYADETALFAKLPRLAFDDACTIR